MDALREQAVGALVAAWSQDNTDERIRAQLRGAAEETMDVLCGLGWIHWSVVEDDDA